eukprot:6182746-Pleurochrysis_carterae.AAC.2
MASFDLTMEIEMGESGLVCISVSQALDCGASSVNIEREIRLYPRGALDRRNQVVVNHVRGNRVHLTREECEQIQLEFISVNQEERLEVGGQGQLVAEMTARS